MTISFTNQFETALQTEINACPVADVPAGTVLRQPDNSHVRLTPLVLEGSIKVTRVDANGKEIIMYFINPGESCFLTITASLANSFGSVDSLRAVTEDATRMIMITDEQIRRWHEQYSTWRTFVTQLYNLRFTEFFGLVDAIAFKNVDERMADRLRTLAVRQNPIPITHAELASYLGTAREVVSRLLKRLEMDGRVRLKNKRIEVIRL